MSIFTVKNSITATAAILIVFLHLQVLVYGGGLWRDEASSAALASRSFGTGIHDDLKYDSYPPVSTIIFHGWSKISNSDISFRILGFLIGITILGAFFYNSYLMGISVPFLSLSFFGFNFIAVHYGDSIRPYGLGILFILVTFGLVWKFATTSDTWKLFVLTTMFAILSVQTMYQNSFLLFACCIAGMLVAYLNKNYTKVWEIFSVGLISAVSLIPYIGFIRYATGWSSIAKVSSGAMNLKSVLADALGLSMPIILIILILILVASVLKNRKMISLRKDLFIYSLVALLAGGISYLTFLQIVRVPAQVWYFIPILAFVGICADAIFTTLFEKFKYSDSIMAFVFIIFLFILNQNDPSFLESRFTNVDLIVNQVSDYADDKDLIVINPWQMGVSFNRFYKGQTKWITFPEFSDHTIFRYDIMKQKMSETDPIEPSMATIRSTLSNGGKVWVIGDLGKEPQYSVKPAGGFMNPYLNYWTNELTSNLQEHAIVSSTILVESDRPINKLENASLTLFSGWK